MARCPAHSAHPPEHIEQFEDPSTGLTGVVVLHSTRLGPAAGGCRFWSYPSRNAMIDDAVRLAEGMSYKNAMADLPFGGGKAVLQMPSQPFDRPALFAAFGDVVARLAGKYVTAEDVGTNVEDMASAAGRSRHVAGLRQMDGKPGGDPSPWTARGVFGAMEVAVERRLNRPIAGATITVQGLGSVGFALCALLHQAGARLIVAEPRKEVAARAARLFDASIVPIETIIGFEADVFAPCALGGILDGNSIARLKTPIVCGAANNQLRTSEDGARLADAGILYAPDYIVNAGGIINVAAEYLGWSNDDVELRVDAIGTRLRNVCDQADHADIATHDMADMLARQRIASESITEKR